MTDLPEEAVEVGATVIVLPAGWYLGAHGDPVAVFEVDSPRLLLHRDGSVTWYRPEEKP